MADTKISALTSASTPLAGTEVLPIVQSGVTKKVSVANLTVGRTVTASSVVVSSGEARLDLTATNGGGRTFNLYSGGGGNVGAGTFAIAEGGATQRFLIEGGGSGESARITNNGKLLIGTTTNSGSNLVVAGNLGTNVGNNASSIRITNTATGNYASIGAGVVGSTNDGMQFSVDGASKMFIDGTGRLIIGPTAWNGGANNSGLMIKTSSTSSGVFAMTIDDSANANIFNFRCDGSAYNKTGTWGTISDKNLKENIVDATPKLDDLMALKVRNFNFKSDESKTKQIGFVAQEMESVFPGLIAEDSEGYKSVKTTVLIPMLVKAIQEQQSLIKDLTTRLSALEAN